MEEGEGKEKRAGKGVKNGKNKASYLYEKINVHNPLRCRMGFEVQAK